MNCTYYGVVTTAPDAAGFAVVAFSDQERLVYFHPPYFASAEAIAALWGPVESGDYVAVSSGTPQWHGLKRIKQGTAVYIFEGA